MSIYDLEVIVNYLEQGTLSPMDYINECIKECISDLLYQTCSYETENIIRNIDFRDWVKESSDQINNDFPTLLNNLKRVMNVLKEDNTLIAKVNVMGIGEYNIEVRKGE